MVKQEFEYIIKQSGAGQPKKLVFLFHGYGLNAHAMEKMADLLIEEMEDVLVIMPHAPEPLHMPDDNPEAVLRVPQQLIGDSTLLNEGWQWFDISGSDINDYRLPLYALAEQLNAFIDTQRNKYHLQDEDIAIMGFSQGGAVAIYTAMLRDNPVACLVAHSTVFMGGKSLNSVMPVLFVYGDADEELDGNLYKDSIVCLRKYFPSVDVKIFPELSHKTSDQPRRVASAFIKKNLVL